MNRRAIFLCLPLLSSLLPFAGCSVDVTASPAVPDGEVPDHTAGDSDAGSDAPTSCDNAAACATPPAAVCANGNTLRTYANPGTCSDGVCSHASSESACVHGCQNGACGCPSEQWKREKVDTREIVGLGNTIALGKDGTVHGRAPRGLSPRLEGRIRSRVRLFVPVVRT